MFMPLTAVNNRRRKTLCFPVIRLFAVRPSSVYTSSASRDISVVYAVEGFQRNFNLLHMFITWMGIIEQPFQVKGRRSRS